jgi:hypothetical protein
MKKITLLIILVLATTFGYAQNVFTNGTFDDPLAWTVIQQNGNNNATAVIASGIATFEDVTQAAWGSEGHIAIYKAFTVAATGYYQFDADVTANGVDEHWFELWVGTAAPVDGAEYNSDSGAVNLLALNAWDCGDYKTYSGSWLATGCKGLDGKIQLDAGTTYYALIRTGGITWGTGIILDNITLVTTTAPAVPVPLTNFNFDFETATPLVAAESATFNDDATNTVTDGINPTANVGEISGINVSWWSQLKYQYDDGVDLSAGNKGFSIKVKGPRALPVTIKVEGSEEHSVSVDYTTLNVWQKLDFDFSSFTTNTNTKIAIFFGIQEDDTDFPDANDNIFQVDDFVFGAFASLSTKNFKIEGLTTYPNPVTSSWAISTKNQVIKTVEVFNLLGSKVVSLKPNALKVNIDASSLAPGMYITNITTELGTASRKLIKQ